jgi:hypothetical protein
LPTFHSQGPARRSFPKQISQFVASAAIAVDLSRSSSASQPGDFADIPQELRQPSTWPYAAHLHSLTLVDRPPAREPCQSTKYCPLPTLIAGAARTLATDRARVVKTGGFASSRRLLPVSPFWVRNLASLPRFTSLHRALPVSTRHPFVAHCRGGLLRSVALPHCVCPRHEARIVKSIVRRTVFRYRICDSGGRHRQASNLTMLSHLFSDTEQ